ncbi:MAG: hypothetical protein L6R42_010428, partial [Xanthoria sp. 1 TBL-2021]
ITPPTEDTGAEEVLDLGFGYCQLQVQVPKNGPYKEPKDLIGRNISTSFAGLSKKYFEALEAQQYGGATNGNGTTSKQLRTKIKYLGGSVEAACALGVADGIVDLVESGETMKAAGLEAIDTVVESKAVLIRSKHPSNPELVDKIARRIKGVIAAQKYVTCTYNVPRKLLPTVTKITPGKRAPTVTALDEPDWVAVNVMVEKVKIATVMDDLASCGAEDILLRTRLSKAYTLIQSSPKSPPQKRRSWPTDLWTGENTRTPAPPSPDLKPSTATTPPPPYRNLLPFKAAFLAQEAADTTIFNPKYAQQSLFLLQSSLQEYAQDPTFARQLYIHAVVYLLSGLPPPFSLSESEKTSLGSVVPQCLMLPSASAYNDDDDDEESKPTTNTARKSENDNAKKTSTPDDNQKPMPTTTLLHRALSSTLVLIIIFIQFLIPYLHTLFSALRHYDREYN